MQYSPFFNTLYNEKTFVGQRGEGHLGRGQHYSILSTVQWLDVHGNPLPGPNKQKFSVIWDEDHDIRVIKVLEAAYIENILSPVLYIEEKKGCVHVITKDIENAHSLLYKKWNDLCSNPDIVNDVWQLELYLYKNDRIIHCDESGNSTYDTYGDKDYTYLKNINNLWSLGMTKLCI